MRCPHCLVEYHEEQKTWTIGKDADGGWILVRMICPACERFTMLLLNGPDPVYDHYGKIVKFGEEPDGRMVYPKGSRRPPCPVEVPKDIADDYTEACLVLADSPKA